MPAMPLPKVPLLGECRRFDGKFAPEGWAICDGSLLQVKENPALFKILGRVAGGDGKKTFALPSRGKYEFVIAVAGFAPASPKQLADYYAQQATSGRTGAAEQPPARAIPAPAGSASSAGTVPVRRAAP